MGRYTSAMKRPNIKTILSTVKRRSKKDPLPVSLRKNTTEIFYQQSKLAKMTVPLHEEPHLRQWKHWKIIDNAFPYDVAFSTHHLLLPKRVVPENELTGTERAELEKILEAVSDEYDCLLVNFISKQSVRNHFHVHLMTYKDERSNLTF